MKLYSRFGAESVDSDGIEYKADKDGGIEVPAELGNFLHLQHVGGERAWENDAERAARMVAEEHARRSDPAYLATIVEELSAKVDSKPVRKASKPAGEADVEADVVEAETAVEADK